LEIELIEGVKFIPLKIIPTKGGDVLHGMKSTDDGFYGFGEAYFSIVEHGSVKAWKRHRRMTLNLIVPHGSIQFVIHDDRDDSKTKGLFESIKISRDNYYRLSIPPMLWLGFKGCSQGQNILLNIASIPHDPNEADNMDESEIDYNWE
tara:strand:- start:1053 stop:1496 length:444 start_codon:yes stop_codon:yes gene_type:complete